MTNVKAKLKRIVKGAVARKIPTPYPIVSGGGTLSGRCALITGGGSGIGYAIAEQFVKNKASVIITGRNEDKLKKAAEALKKITIDENQKIYFFKMDISLTSEIDKTIDKIIKNIENKTIDILVNNAGVSSGDNFGRASVEGFERVFKTNVEGTYFVSQKIYNYMKENKIKGNILNVLSSSSKRPAASPYMMSKWASRGLTLGMAKICIKEGIVVNAVAPGPTATKMMMKNPQEDISLDNSPIGRYIMPEEIANVAVMLVSDAGRCIVGDTVYVTGGAGIITFDDISY